MKVPPMPVSDDDLHALVDGQLDPERVAEVWTALQTDPERLQQVAQWQAQRLALRRLSRSLEVGETPPVMTDTVRRAQREAWRWHPWAQSLAAAVLLAVGLGGGWWLGQPGVPGSVVATSPRFVHDAKVAHAVFVPEKRHPVEVTAADEAHLVQWLSRRLDTTLRVPVLSALGYRLLGGRLLPGEATPRAQFMYEDAQGHRLTLYVAVFAAGQAPGETAFRSVREGDAESFYWAEGRFGYALNAQLPSADIQVLAREVYAQLAR